MDVKVLHRTINANKKPVFFKSVHSLDGHTLDGASKRWTTLMLVLVGGAEIDQVDHINHSD